MKPEEINDRFISRFVEKLKNMPCIPAGETAKPGDGIHTRYCQTCRQPQLADDGLKCLQCGADDLTKKKAKS